MQFQVFGPFTIPRKTNGLIDRNASAQRTFWAETVAKSKDGDEKLPNACGCYVFAVSAAGGIIPWYIGLTRKRSFSKECLGSHQVGYYNDVLASRDRARPLLYLLAKKTPEGRFAKASKTGHADINFLETFLIGHGLNRNEELLNQRKTKFLKSICVPGILNSRQGHPGKQALSLRDAFGL